MRTAVNPTDPPEAPTKVAYSIAEIAELAGVGRSTVYAAINDGSLLARKRGSRTLILHEDLQRWLAGLAPITPKAK